jgi:hypothetical protein
MQRERTSEGGENVGKRTAAGALLLCAAALAGCRNDPADTPDEFDIAFAELRVGTQAARVTNEGVVEGEITLPVGDTIGSIVFVDADGDELDFQDDDERNVIVSSGNTAVLTWTRLNKETGIIAALAEGSTTLSITLSHGDHNDFGPQSIPITVAAAAVSGLRTGNANQSHP